MEEGIQEVDEDTDALRTKIPGRFNRIQVKQILKIADFWVKQITQIKDFRTTILVSEIKTFEDASTRDLKDEIQDDIMVTIKGDSVDVKINKEDLSTKVNFAIFKT